MLERRLAALRQDRARALRDEASTAEQEALELRAHRAGWCLGVLASAMDVDLLRARREPRGLQWLVDEVAAARGLILQPASESLPRFTSAAPSFWEVPLLAAWCALHAGRPMERVLHWSGGVTDGGGVRLVFEREGARRSLENRCARLSHPNRSSSRLGLASGRIELRFG